MTSRKAIKTAKQVGETQVLAKIINGRYILESSFYMLSIILNNLNVTQLSRDLPIGNPFVNTNKLTHRHE